MFIDSEVAPGRPPSGPCHRTPSQTYMDLLAEDGARFRSASINMASMNQSLVSSTNVDTLLSARHKSATRDLTLNVAPNIRPPLLKFGFPLSIVASWRDQSSIRALWAA